MSGCSSISTRPCCAAGSAAWSVVAPMMSISPDFARRKMTTPHPADPSRRDQTHPASVPIVRATDPNVSRLPASPPPCEFLCSPSAQHRDHEPPGTALSPYSRIFPPPRALIFPGYCRRRKRRAALRLPWLPPPDRLPRQSRRSPEAPLDLRPRRLGQRREVLARQPAEHRVRQ